MDNPPNFYQNPGSYDDILKQMTQRMQQKQVDNQIVTMLQQAFEKELTQGNLVLSRSERGRLFQQVSKTILRNVIRKIDDIR
ncbi:MAG: hypothetical protein KDJ65_29675 [Anaerolineae bacterium]|nr:hypothetical protein [Anaerolineae bacterium]